jgi:hypothetical protein
LIIALGGINVKTVVIIAIALSLFACTTVKVSPDGSRVRAVTEVDEPNCRFIAKSKAKFDHNNHIFDLDTYYLINENGFKNMINTVALAGGDGYVIQNIDEMGAIYDIEVWDCGWNDSNAADFSKPALDPLEISANERNLCRYIKTFVHSSVWGWSKSNNFNRARRGAIHETL